MHGRKGGNTVAIKTKKEVLDGLKKFIPIDDTSDDTLAFLQDVSDTLDAGAENVDYKQQLEDNDKKWRQRYRDTFYNPPGNSDPEPDPDPEPKRRTYADLFKTE